MWNKIIMPLISGGVLSQLESLFFQRGNEQFAYVPHLLSMIVRVQETDFFCFITLFVYRSEHTGLLKAFKDVEIPEISLAVSRDYQPGRSEASGNI